MTIDVATKQFNSAIVTGEFRGIVDCYELTDAELDLLAGGDKNPWMIGTKAAVEAGKKTVSYWSDKAAPYLEAAKLTFLSWF